MKKFKINLSVLAATALVTGAANAYDLNLGKDQTISFHGFLSQGCMVSDDYNYLGRTADGGSFQFTEIGLNASYSPFERTRIAVQGFAFDVGDIGDLEPFLDYASLEYTFSDCIGLRGGRVRRPGGLYNHIQDVDLARTSVLLPQGMYDARWRDFSTSVDGGVAFGNLQMDKAGSLSYEAFAGMMNVSMDGGVASLLKQSLPPGANLDDIPQSPIAGAQLWWNTPISGLRAGAMLGQVFNFGYEVTAVSPFVGVINLDTEGDIFVQQYSLEYLWKAWTFQAEYYTYNYRNHTVQQNTVLGTSVTSSKSIPDTWYVSAAYRFNKWLEVGTYYTEFYDNVHDRDGSSLATPSDAFQKDVALSFRFDPLDWWIIKLEGHYIRGTALLRDNGSNPIRNDDGWWLFGAKTTISF